MFLIGEDLFKSSSGFIGLNKFFFKNIFFALISKSNIDVTHPIIIVVSYNVTLDTIESSEKLWEKFWEAEASLEVDTYREKEILVTWQ